MKTIWKWSIEITDEQVIEVPTGMIPLCVQVQEGTPVIWGEVDPFQEGRERLHIRIHGTGNESIQEDHTDQYFGSLQMPPFVWHIYLGERT